MHSTQFIANFVNECIGNNQAHGRYRIAKTLPKKTLILTPKQKATTPTKSGKMHKINYFPSSITFNNHQRNNAID